MSEHFATIAAVVGICTLLLGVLGAYLRVGQLFRTGMDQLSGRFDDKLGRVATRLDAVAEQVTYLRAEVAALAASTVKEEDCRERHEALAQRPKLERVR